MNIYVLYSSFYQNYQMNLSDFYQMWERNIVFMHVKQTILLRNRKVRKMSVCRFPNSKAEKEKRIKDTPNVNVRVRKNTSFVLD